MELPIPSLVLGKWLVRIEQSPNLEMLRHVCELIARTHDRLTPADLAYCCEVVAARERQLSTKSVVV